MADIDVDARLVQALLDPRQDTQRVARVPEPGLVLRQRRGRSLRAVCSRSGRSSSSVERSVAERALRESDREPLRGKRALRRDLQRLVKVLGRARILGRPVLLRLLGRIFVLARVDVVQGSGSAQGVHVVPREFLQGRLGKLARELELARLDEEVGVEGAQFGVGRLRSERLLDELV